MTISERLARLPVAVNNADSFRAELSQSNSEKNQNPITKSITEVSSFTKSLYAVDRPDYTKEDAINKQWKKMNTMNILEVLEGTVDTSCRGLSAKDVENQIQKGDLLNEVSDIDLRMLQFELSGLEFEEGRRYQAIDSGELYKNVKYLASRYVAMEDKIKKICTGAEQTERLNQLNKMYAETLEKMAKSYSEVVGGILEGYGVSGEKEKIYQSFKSGVDQQVDEYRMFLKQDQKFTGLGDIENAWLLKDDEYIAAMLRKFDHIPEASASNQGEYSLEELDVLGQYVSSLSTMEAKAVTYEMTEERLGLDLAMLAMKTDVLCKEKNVGSVLNKTLKETLNGYLNVFLDRFNQKLEINRRNPLIEADIQGNAELNKESVWKVYNKTIEQYRISGNVMKALIKGAEYGRSQYLKRMELENLENIYRYKNSSFYWIDFFENILGRRTNSYEKEGNAYEQYMVGWLDFKNSLREGDSVRMNLLLKSINSYSINQNGNWISINA
ncbi:hypothetical protein AALD22_15640 [Lachnospiraceae bacterium 56-18]